MGAVKGATLFRSGRLSMRRGLYCFVSAGGVVTLNLELLWSHCRSPMMTLTSTDSDDRSSSRIATKLPSSSELPTSTLPSSSNETLARRKKAIDQQYLTPQEEKALVAYVLRCADNGFPLPVKALRRLALVIRQHRGSVCSTQTSDGTVQPPGKNYPQALYSRHPELRARRLKAIDWTRANENIYDKVKHWFDLIGKELANPDITPENVYNMDETGVLLGHAATVKMLVHSKDTRRHRSTGVKRILVTSIECVSAAGIALPPLIIWPASTHRSVWTTHPTPNWHFACSPKGYTDKLISLSWIKDVFDPRTRVRACGKPRLLINDGFATHESAELLEFCFHNNIILCRLPSHTSHKLQPLDVGIFGPLKTAYREQVEQLYRGGAGVVGKQHFTLLYSRARQIAFTESNIISAWDKVGLFRFDPNRVLATVSRPPTDQTTTQIVPTQTQFFSADETQATPVTSEGFAALRRLIECESQQVSELSQRRMQKALNAAERALTESSLLRDRSQELFLQNCEKKLRVSTKSKVVETARVMSYQDIIEKRSAKEIMKTAGSGTGARRQVPTVGKRSLPVSNQAPRKRRRQGELQQAI